MAFWNLAESEPRRQHRFLLNFPLLTGTDGQATDVQYLAKTVTKPAYTIGEVEHKFLGNTYYYPGAVTWDPVTATLVNAVEPDGNDLLMTALYKSGYFDPTDQAGFFGAGTTALGNGIGPGTVNKSSALAATGDVIIREIDGLGLQIGEWTLKSPFITNAKFGDLDYGGEDLLNLEITLRYDYALYRPVGGDVRSRQTQERATQNGRVGNRRLG
jgi:hypothetical protein